MSSDTAELKLNKAKKDFLVITPILAIFILLMTQWHGDSLTMGLLKTTFSPIFMLAIIGTGFLLPKSPGDSVKYIIIRQAIGTLPVAFFILVAEITPGSSIDILALNFVIFYVFYFLGTCIFELFTNGGSKKQFEEE